jgi:phytoene/squalene synthetase
MDTALPSAPMAFKFLTKLKKEERDLMKAMIADALDHMQEAEDYIETVELKNLLPFNDLP